MKKKYSVPLVITICLIVLLFLLPQTRNATTIISSFTVMSATIGPIMGLFYPFTLLIKVQYVSGLLASGGVCIIGIMERKKWWGKILMILGVLLWILLGFIGLGTGV